MKPRAFAVDLARWVLACTIVATACAAHALPPPDPDTGEGTPGTCLGLRCAEQAVAAHPAASAAGRAAEVGDTDAAGRAPRNH